MHRSQIIYLILRRLRTPLIVLVCVYAVSVLGFVLIPGVDDQGNSWKMDFFHAFYFVSYMGSTIGFGELPYPFTDAQRIWTTCTIYATVISWLYAIGTLLALVQSPSFQAALTRNAFERRVGKIRDPFFMVCGYGDTGRIIVNALVHQGKDCVVIDKDIDRVNELELSDLPREVLHLHGDCSDTEVLSRAGIRNRYCRGVVAVTRDDQANLKVAIVSKLLNPGIKVYCWAENEDTGANMASFGTDHIINPYSTFAQYLSTALTSPNRYLLHQWLTTSHTEPRCKPIHPPKGRWILCGYGRFGKAVYRSLLQNGLPVTVIELDAQATEAPEGTVVGRGTEADTLEEAQINKAVGIIAGTDHDVNNLSIVLTARELNPDLFTIARLEHASNRELFEAANMDLVTENNDLIASQLLAHITTPLTTEFLEAIRDRPDEWCENLVKALDSCIDETNPYTWIVTADRDRSPALWKRLIAAQAIALNHLTRNPTNRKELLPCIALMKNRAGSNILLPAPDTEIQIGDRILFAGTREAERMISRLCKSPEDLHYTVTGSHIAAGTLGRWLERSRSNHSTTPPLE